MMRRLPVFCLLLWIACWTSACKHKDNSSTQAFRLNLSSGSLESLDPAYAKDLYTMWTTHMLYNTLLEADSNLHLVPSLARSWEVSPDGRTYTFHLRNDVFFHDNPLFPGGKGRRMTATDVAYSFERLIDPATASPGAWIFNGKVRETAPFTATDDSTFVLHLQEDFRPMAAMLSMPYCGIVPREVAEHWGKDFRSHPCGTGPYQFHYWDEGNVLMLQKNKSYWEFEGAERLPFTDAVQITFFDSKATEFLLFLQGKLDFINNIDGSFKDLILRKDGTLKAAYKDKFHLKISRYLNTEYLGFLVDSSNPLAQNSLSSNKLVRQAINYAIDRKKIATYFKNGTPIPATGGFTPPGIGGFDTVAHYGYHYDPAKAIALLEQAGFPRGKGLQPVNILTPENYADIVNFVANQLQEIGIPAKIEVMQPNILRQQMSRSEALFFRAQWIADYPDAETYLAYFNSNFPAPPNYTRYHNPVFDKLYAESMQLPDTARWRIYRVMDSMAIADAPVVPLYYERLLHFTQNRITGFISTPMNIIDLKRVRVLAQQ